MVIEQQKENLEGMRNLCGTEERQRLHFTSLKEFKKANCVTWNETGKLNGNLLVDMPFCFIHNTTIMDCTKPEGEAR